MNKPIISIGMPVYNGEKYIEEALESLLSQTFSNFELIISDNNSTDQTNKICEYYAKKDKRIRYLRQTNNLGAIANFQFVLNQSVGRYFMWAAYDDKWSLNWLESLYKEMELKNVNMVFGQVVHIDEQSKLMKHPANNAVFEFVGHYLSKRCKFFLANEALGKANTIYSLYRAEMIPILNAILSDFVKGNYIYDHAMVFSCLKYTDLIQVNDTFLYKRVHFSSEGFILKNKLGFLNKIRFFMYPMLPNLLSDYLHHALFFEKIIILFLLPIKLIAHDCFIILNKFISNKYDNS
ncbi:Glycosyltransferase GlyG [Patescibacteria group bacterium]|nr:Glycosyltransferase GlyG [Patescibacteria group bacterium]